MNRSVKQNVYLECDGHKDDLLTYIYLLLRDDVNFLAAGITNACCFCLSSFAAFRRVEHVLKLPKRRLGVDSREMPNQFPPSWRGETQRFSKLPSLARGQSTNDQPEDSCSLLADVLSKADSPVTIICTGPLTTIADVLTQHPHLVSQVRQLVCMGGAIYVRGNVRRHNTDGSAEWNIYADPDAFKTILEISNLPIRLISLDVTNKLPINRQFLDSLQRLGQTSPAARICYEIWTMQKGGGLFLWDPTTAVSVIRPDWFRFEHIDIDISLEGPSQGQVYRVPDGKGRSIELARDVQSNAVLDGLLKTMSPQR